MKKCIILIGLMILLSGCGTISSNLRDKSINSGVDIYGLKITAFDPSTGSLSPTGFIGFGGVWYNSHPVKRGQSFRVVRKKKSFWSGEYSEVVLIEIGKAPEDGTLEVEGGDILDIPLVPVVNFYKNKEE